MLADYHVHTEFSDDSREPMEEQVKKAVSLGLTELCFTDHVDYGIKKDWSEGNIEYRGGDGIGLAAEDRQPLANVDYPAYFAKFRRLRDEYRREIALRCGLEFGVQVGTIPRYEELFARYEQELDFVLLSIHQVENKEFWNQAFQEGRTQQEYNERYYQEMYDVIKAFKHYSVLAHLNLISRYDKQGKYPFATVRDMVAEILKVAIADGKGIELNTSSWHYGLDDTMPSRDILRLYKDLGGKIITIGSDAHSTKYLADHMRDAREILANEIGFAQIYTFEHGEPIAHDF
ncbi:histidinol-phosphatase HisJ family protein [Selenomonas ruminantium]|uniref:Histidinol-phosphatase n=1 Tax=Selenomonas ruminantium TaxID=971 RepID=A0A1H0NDW0_SELRU|nr:histidinol-phosphatase HisJ family protein [Selenomonas ruminantium]SDO90480.1 histidinol-phosphatase (PHP family) [Selenomonas ruminantium]